MSTTVKLTREVFDCIYDRRVYGIIEDVLQQAGGHPPFAATAEFAPDAEFAQAADFALAAEFAAVLQQCVGDPLGSLQSSKRPLPWRYLPILCYQAVRGHSGSDTVTGELSLSVDPSVVIAAALELARLAAQILDDVEDGDAGSALWLSSGVPQAVNVGTGLIFASLLALSRLRDCGVAPEMVVGLQAEFARTGFRMCEGQHLDLAAEADDDRKATAVGGWRLDRPQAEDPAPAFTAALSLKTYWQIVRAKTSAFLELGCRAGALLGGATKACPERSRRDEIAPYAEYGCHLGLLVQIVNDLGGLLDEEGGSDLVRHKKTLPLIYALSVAGENEGERLRRAWAEAPYDAGACREVRRLVVELGALQYAFVQGELHHRRALSALQKARGNPEALAGLTALLDQYRPASLLSRVAGQTEFGT